MTRRNRTWLARGAGLLLVGAFVVAGWSSRGRFSPSDTGTLAPAYSAVTLDGETVALSDYAGQVVLLNVWATWCAPCVREMPALQRLHDELGPKGLAVVAVSVDSDVPGFGGVDAIRSFAVELGLTFTILHDPTGAVERTFQVMGLPVTLVISRTGHIQQRVLGAREWDDPRHVSEIEKLLAD